VSVFGDGATNQGAVHEALNMAAVFSLPVIFVCENNVYSELTPIEEMVAEPELYRRAAAYGMQASRVDGNDVSAMAAAVSDAAERCRRGGGPVFLEAMTYRLCGHYIGDAETYRTATEVSERSLIEPIKVTGQQLRARGVDEDELDKLDRSVRARVDAAADGALAAPLADTATLGEHLYA
jgi:pyruvate dehydrogenase E1 component alpha subunit